MGGEPGILPPGRAGELSLQEVLHNVFVRVAYHPSHSGKLRYLPGRPLRVTARDQDSAVGIRAPDTADDLAGFSVCGGSDCTRVQNRDVAVLEARAFLEPGVEQLLLQSRPVGLTRPATEIDQEKPVHRSRAILADLASGRHRLW